MDNELGARWRRSHWVGGAALLAAGAVAGGVLASTLSASAADSNSATPGGYAPGHPGSPPGHGGAQPVRNDEKSLSAAKTATLRAAALKAVPGGSVYRIESDAGDGVYEAHMQRANGTLVTVKFDDNLKVTKVEAGMGTGDPGPSH
jgi:hypothetical protein